MKAKTCKVCKTSYTPQRMGQKVCGPACAMSLASSVRAKVEKVEQVKERKAHREAVKQTKKPSYFAAKAQTAFNAFIRARDAGQPCISCQRTNAGPMQAGHYLSRGARPELRFNEQNTHAQCVQCNMHFAGNVAKYRIGLIAKIGLDNVEWLEGPHPLPRYSIEDYQAIEGFYKYKTKELI